MAILDSEREERERLYGGYPCDCGRTHSVPDCWREMGNDARPNTDALRERYPEAAREWDARQDAHNAGRGIYGFRELADGQIIADLDCGARAVILPDAGRPPFAWAITRGARIYAQGENWRTDGAKANIIAYMGIIRRIIRDLGEPACDTCAAPNPVPGFGVCQTCRLTWLPSD